MGEFTQMGDEVQREMGLQPLDQLLNELHIENHDLVETSTEQLTHKQVQKARKGRRVTSNIQNKVLKAVRGVLVNKEVDRELNLNDLFNYRG